ncbi:MAG TPA: SDR family NAD(P)-dependent oxidoreductase [Candidatus Cybelea sp.]|jgi:short-subunit dehydrogenase|nr:SDR family NAD(P)-dependent oxidoreductase [Candidatus Cybelea sp.]
MPENGRTLIVTGASSGIGRALAFAAASDGYRVVMVARRGNRLDETAQTIRGAGGSCVGLAGDVTAREMPGRIVDAALRTFGRIDVVVNNAGSGAYGALLEQTDAAIEAQWQLNVAAPLRIARAAMPSLEATHGQLVFVGTGSARMPLPHYGAYAPAKAAIRAAAIQLRRELRPIGITVTYVDPGLVGTEFHSTIGIERAQGIPPVSPDRVAHAILRGIARRSAVVNAVGWQTAGTVLGEWLGTLADPIVISRFTPRKVAAHPEPPRHLEPAESKDKAEPTSLEKALEPVARRMERVKLPESFVREALVPGSRLELNSLAMRWAGMPNKNERAALREVVDALEAGGYLERVEEETWMVVRAAD